jgi:hypothetical protein
MNTLDFLFLTIVLSHDNEILALAGVQFRGSFVEQPHNDLASKFPNARVKPRGTRKKSVTVFRSQKPRKPVQ